MPGGAGGNMPGFNAPQMQYVEIKQCMKCKKEVPSTAKAGDKCPHCGVYWNYEQNKDGSKTWSGLPRGFFKLGFLVIMVIGAIVAAVKKAMG